MSFNIKPDLKPPMRSNWLRTSDIEEIHQNHPSDGENIWGAIWEHIYVHFGKHSSTGSNKCLLHWITGSFLSSPLPPLLSWWWVAGFLIFLAAITLLFFLQHPCSVAPCHLPWVSLASWVPPTPKKNTPSFGLTTIWAISFLYCIYFVTINKCVIFPKIMNNFIMIMIIAITE